ncbi:hypothetical protein HIM_07836 [Hirsutella minnesotensis 3608]|uniref:Carboxylic ester hydrolase n=1 Tax=Hirsutella minnesotensis 3608 TaxID=1043627 RepID=A0A0F7ZHJ7_9HYPO|nr:hypothetical protein HIM_07836 [Hirsutella minnesotensis 3608]
MLISTDERHRLGKILSRVLELPFLKTVVGQEDCLTLDITRPAGSQPGDKLPVLFWIFGGGFQIGSTQSYDAKGLLTHALHEKQPFIFVAVNYRLGGFGFLPGKEVLRDGSANLGLLDQRMGLQWVADNIHAFGGDASKVTIWGESAGGTSVYHQMLLHGGNATYKGKSLFRGAIINSGSAIPVQPVDSSKGQSIFNRVAQQAGCNHEYDPLACLRKLPYEKFLHAASSVPSLFSYNSLALPYLPRPDGQVVLDSPEKMTEQGKIHPVPLIIGDQEDEGTLFSIFQRNVSSATRMADYLSSYFFPQAPIDKLREFVDLYEPAISEGSPFRTDQSNDLYPGFKRVAAIIGDINFTGNRRVALEALSKAKPDLPTWSYLSSYAHKTPILGTFHGSDILQIFFGLQSNHATRSCRSYYLNFLHHLDPNIGTQSSAQWPQWKANQDLMWFKSQSQNDILRDNFRSGPITWMANHQQLLHL